MDGHIGHKKLCCVLSSMELHVHSITEKSRYSHTLYIYCYVSPVTLPNCSFMDCHQVAGDANFDKAGVQFITLIWQEKQVHESMRTFEFNHKVRLWKYCALMLLSYLIRRWNQGWTKVIQLHNISMWKYCKIQFSATATIINPMTSMRLNFNVKNFPCDNSTVSFYALQQQL